MLTEHRRCSNIVDVNAQNIIHPRRGLTKGRRQDNTAGENLKKHSIFFEEAKTAFAAPNVRMIFEVIGY